MRLQIGLAIVCGLALFIVLWGAAVAMRTPSPLHDADPPPAAATYQEAVVRIARLDAAAPAPNPNPDCGTRLLSHGRRTGKAVILLHGLTSCPLQYSDLAPELFAEGWNVLVPLLPRHGSKNRRGPGLSGLTAEELDRFAAELAAIGPALGERAVIAGLSAGGAVAARAASRFSWSRAVLVAPCLGILNAGVAGSRVIRNAALALPDRFFFWDPREGDSLPGPSYAYTGFSSRALGEVLRLSAAVNGSAPATRDVRIVINANDHSVDRESALTLARQWKASGAAVQVFEFSRSEALRHDFIDPRQLGYKKERAVPVLRAAIAADDFHPGSGLR
jgi:carboxylesterase